MDIQIIGYCGGYPFNGGATAGILIKNEKGNLLLDCGSGVVSKLSNEMDLEDIDALILSHLHFDHCADVGILQYIFKGALRTGKIDKKLQMYLPKQPQEVQEIFCNDTSNISIIEDKDSIEINGINIKFKSVSHTIPCYAMRLEFDNKVLVYSADTSFDKNLISLAQDADLLICEATICSGSVHTTGKGHMDAREAGKIAKESNAKKLILTHLPHDGNYENMKEEAKNVFGKEVYTAVEYNKIKL